MTLYRKAFAVAVAGAVASVSLAACGGGGSSDDSNTLQYISFRPAEHFDPQRVYIGRDISNLGRLAYRSLVANPVTTDVAKSTELIPDLATDTGTVTDGGKTWEFTLKDGVKWEDGKDITCDDLKYGVSRTFATSVITGGPNYILGYLDIPVTKNAEGQEVSQYEGPYTGKGQALFDKAVTCEGKTITYHFKKAFPDFGLAIAALRAFDPYRQDKDQGEKSNFAVFSSGPYKLDGLWKSGKGGTFVKNTAWDPATDTIRKQNVDKIVFTEGLTDETVTARMIADRGTDKNAITDRNILAASYSKITGAVADRATLNDSPYVFYLLPNFKRVTNPQVREALKYSTDVTGWITAQGGDKAYRPAESIIASTLVGAQPNPAFQDMNDVEKAKQLLRDSGATLPYPINYTYNSSPTADKAAAALKAGWEAAGFKVTLDPLADTYYDVINKKNSKSDVVIAGWGADWPSIGTVLPPLFDGRLNLQGSDTNGNDYGNYNSPVVNGLFDKAAAEATVEGQAGVYTEADVQLGKDVAYIPIGVQQFYLLHGSNVDTYIQNPATSMFPDLGDISLK